MPKRFWIILLGYALIMSLARVLVLRDLPLLDALVARDFSNVYIAGKLVWNGGLDRIYDVASYAEQSWNWIGTHWGNKYSYPPHSLLLAAPFGLLPYPLAFLIWNGGSLALFWLAARPYVPASLPAWAAIFTPAALTCLVFGHYGLLIGALWLWAFRGSGEAAALMTVKPHLGLMIFIRALLDRRMFMTAVAITIALVGLSILLFGLQLWPDYLSKAFAYQSEIVTSRRPSINLVSAYSAYGLWLQLGFAGAASWLLYRHFNAFTAATATFLILPYAMHYDLTVVCLGMAVLLAVGWDRMNLIERLVLILAYLVPVLVRGGGWIAPPILLAALYVQVRHFELLDAQMPGLLNSNKKAAR